MMGGTRSALADRDASCPRCCCSHEGSPDIIVAVIDSGIYLEHPDIKDGLWVNSGEIPGNGIDDDGNGETGSISISRPSDLLTFFLYHAHECTMHHECLLHRRNLVNNSFTCWVRSHA